MKYVIMFTSTPELDAAVPPERAEEVYGRIYEWFGEHADADHRLRCRAAARRPPRPRSRHGGGGPVVVDGPFSEAKEVIGGFSVIDVPDLDAAIALVKTWPMLELPGTSVEIRPMVVDYSQFEQ